MALTKQEKRAFAVPALIGLLLIGLVGYNWHLSFQNRKLNEMIEKIDTRIREIQNTFKSLEKMEKEEKFYFQYRLNDWIPIFRNILEVKLYLTKKVKRVLDSVGAQEKDWEWIPLEEETKPLLSEYHLEALFPSYSALVQFIQEMENSIPPLLPQGVEIKKVGIKIDVNLIMYFGYQLKDETI